MYVAQVREIGEEEEEEKEEEKVVEVEELVSNGFVICRFSKIRTLFSQIGSNSYKSGHTQAPENRTIAKFEGCANWRVYRQIDG